MTPEQGRLRRRLAAVLLASCLLTGSLAPAALADDYEAKRAGHPIRIVAYVLHPFGVAIDYLFLRPAHWLGSHEPFATIFGHEEPH